MSYAQEAVVGHAVERAPESVRRTVSLHMRWPGGDGSRLLGSCFGRDLITTADEVGRVVDAATVDLELVPTTREVVSLATDPVRPALAALVGRRGGIRATLAETIAEDQAAGNVLHQVLDDVAGTALISPFVLSRRLDDRQWDTLFGERTRPLGTCLAFQEGSSAVRPGEPRDRTRVVDELVVPGDPLAWHAAPVFTEPTTRRVRRIDVTRDGADAVVDAWFQDSASEPTGGRVAVHEYRVFARIDGVDHRLVAIEAVPGALPFGECPRAIGNLDAVLGMRCADLRRGVSRELRGTAGCTHLNDAVRALADVPALLRRLS